MDRDEKTTHQRSAKKAPFQQTNLDSLKIFPIKKKKKKKSWVFILRDLSSLFFKPALEYLRDNHLRHKASDDSGRIIFIFTWVNSKIKGKYIFVDLN